MEKELIYTKNYCDKTLIEDEWDITIVADHEIFILVDEDRNILVFGEVEDVPEEFEELKSKYKMKIVMDLLIEDDGVNMKAFY